MKTKWILLVLLAIVFSPSFLHAEDTDSAAAAAKATAASENTLLGAADDLDDFTLEDEGLIADEDLALDEDLEGLALPAEGEAEKI